jgi:DNA-binding CsgD family transcriptional regulator/preprotein translocase subunit SecG
LAASVLGYPLCLLWQDLYIYRQGTTASITGITIIHYPLFFLVCVLLGNNRLRALISASFAFSVVHLANLPVVYFMLVVVHPFLNSLNYVEFFQQNQQIYYGVIFLSNIVIAVCCLFAARWLRETKLKPPLKLYVLFNLLFVLFPLAVVIWCEDMLTAMSVSFLASAFICTLFLGLMLFLFYLYTRLTKDNLTAEMKETKVALSHDRKFDDYMKLVQQLSRRELEVIEAVLAGNVRYKQLSIALNISVSTVKTHLRHIYQTTGVSNIAALSSLFHGYTPHP